MNSNKELSFDKNHVGKIVVISAPDHSSSVNIDALDLERIKHGTATIIAIGLVIDEDDEKILLGSFFTLFNGEKRHYEVHAILKSSRLKVWECCFDTGEKKRENAGTLPAMPV